MVIVGENSQKFISDYSGQFQRDFLQLLRTSHGEKKININHFYQEYISNKEHVHMNATRWPSLSAYAAYLGREGICRVEEGEKGLEVSWIDHSPEALRRQDAIRKKERQDKGDEEREQRLIREQVERARHDAADKADTETGDETRTLRREEGEKIQLRFGGKAAASTSGASTDMERKDTGSLPTDDIEKNAPLEEKASLEIGLSSKPKNVFAAAGKKNALGGVKSVSKMVLQKPMSEAERIMKEEIERKRSREAGRVFGHEPKRQKV
jgi:DNA/RNA-binding protein KIN17